MNIVEMGCAQHNFRVGRPTGLDIEAVVIHIIDGSQASADATFLNNNLDVVRSAHYSVGRQGEIHRYVKEADTAYHAGNVVNPTWAGLKKNAAGNFINPNFYTIGIEHDGRPNDDWTDAMYASSAALLADLAKRYTKLNVLTRSNVVMHREIRADKTCPGFKVDMLRLIREAGHEPAVATSATPATVVATSNVNVRKESPSRSAEVVRVIPKGQSITVTGTVSGEAVANVAGSILQTWYRVDDGFIWSGATDKPS